MTELNPDDKEEMLDMVRASRLHGVKFLFPNDMPAEEQSQRIGLCVTLAAGFHGAHLALNSHCLSQIVFTTDVWKTVAELENLAGGQIDAARNGAEQMTLFLVDSGSFQALVIRDEWFSMSDSNEESRKAAFWLFLEVLATAHFTAHLKSRLGNNEWFSMAAPLGRQVFTLGREALHGYWRGYYSYIEAIKTLAPFNGIRDSVPQEMQEIDLALRRFAYKSDVSRLADDVFQSVYFLAVNMAVAIGCADAAKVPVSVMSPDAWDLIQKAELTKLWVDLGDAARNAFGEKQNWSSFRDILPVGHAGILFMAHLGISYEDDDGQVAVNYIPPFRKVH